MPPCSNASIAAIPHGVCLGWVRSRGESASEIRAFSVSSICSRKIAAFFKRVPSLYIRLSSPLDVKPMGCGKERTCPKWSDKNMTKPIVMLVMLVQASAHGGRRYDYRQPGQSTPDRLA